MIFQQCDPPQKLWNTSIPGNCHLLETGTSIGVFVGCTYKQDELYNDSGAYEDVAFSAASDLFLAIYPFFIFWELNMSWKKKLSLWGLFLGGVV